MTIQDSEIKVNKADSNYLNKQQQSGGLFLGFVFVLMLSSILALALWVNQISSANDYNICLLYTSPSPRDVEESRMPSSA